MSMERIENQNNLSRALELFDPKSIMNCITVYHFDKGRTTVTDEDISRLANAASDAVNAKKMIQTDPKMVLDTIYRMIMWAYYAHVLKQQLEQERAGNRQDVVVYPPIKQPTQKEGT